MADYVSGLCGAGRKGEIRAGGGTGTMEGVPGKYWNKGVKSKHRIHYV